jgi:hypothetical protein
MNKDMKQLNKYMIQRFEDYQHLQPPSNDGLPAVSVCDLFDSDIGEQTVINRNPELFDRVTARAYVRDV